MNASDAVKGSTTPAEPTLVGEGLRKTLAELLGLPPEEVPDDANLIKRGIESLQIMRLLTKVRRAGAEVTFRDLAAEPTYRAWNRLFTQALGAPAEQAPPDDSAG